MTRVAIRVDASVAIGTGHLRRCLTLATALASKGAEVRFVVRRHDAVAEVALRSHTFPVAWLDAPTALEAPRASSTRAHENWAGISWTADAAETVGTLEDFRPEWLIVDHYSFDARWHDEVRDQLGCKIMAIDDLGDRPLSVDLLLDTNFAEDHARKYAGQLTRKCRLLAGPRFALLAAEYRRAPRYRFQPDVRSIGIFMGGTDPDGISAKVLRACREDAGFRGAIEVISTSANPHLEQLRVACAASPDTTLRLDLPDLGAFYASHDLQIGAGGTATYERCCIGAPTIALAVALNQLAVIPALAAAGVLRAAKLPGGSEAEILPAATDLGEVLLDLVAHPEARRGLSQRGMVLVDACGADRVAACLLGASLSLRRATLEDGALLHAWRNHPDVRGVSGSGEVIPLDRHMNWLANKIAAEDSWLYVAEIGPTPIGSIRFDRLPDDLLEVSLYLDPGLLGLGLGPHLLLAGERAVMVEAPDCARFIASVLPTNEVSARLFVKCGYSGGPLRYRKSIASITWVGS
nr:UDP-2,4-diacetamido-2,4,6-trideoxy-beta-L-altropyranose hydrolase [Brevundimonas sp.]